MRRGRAMSEEDTDSCRELYDVLPWYMLIHVVIAICASLACVSMTMKQGRAR
jgi:hypothetical protein